MRRSRRQLPRDGMLSTLGPPSQAKAERTHAIILERRHSRHALLVFIRRSELTAHTKSSCRVLSSVVWRIERSRGPTDIYYTSWTASFRLAIISSISQHHALHYCCSRTLDPQRCRHCYSNSELYSCLQASRPCCWYCRYQVH